MDTRLVRPGDWKEPKILESTNYQCAYCGNQVASVLGWYAGSQSRIRLCPHCNFPTFFGMTRASLRWIQIPMAPPGRPIGNVPPAIAQLYEEARQSAGVGAYTASVLTCRKMLVDLAVDQGDKYERGKRFFQYVEYLAAKMFAPPQGKDWLDRIKDRGNDATHELGVMGAQDAMLLITFIEMILRLLYEFPAMLAPATPDAVTVSGKPNLGNTAGPKPMGKGDGGARDEIPARRR